MSKSGNSKSGGIGFFGLLQILFIALKLTEEITWPWMWVLSPIWIPLVIILLVFVVVFIAGVIKGCLKILEEKERHGK